MKHLVSIATAALIALGGAAPAFAAPSDGDSLTIKTFQVEAERKGRKKPRIPGGSGCDDPGDIIEHPECRG